MDPDSAVVCPGGQAKHFGDDVVFANVPRWHATHCAALTPPGLDKEVPSGHPWHAFEPEEEAYDPGAHVAHVVELVATTVELAVAGGHATQDTPCRNAPGPHGAQALALAVPRPGVVVPAGHATHSASPLVLANVLGTHSTHNRLDAAPCKELAVPGAHSSHTADPGCSWKLPGGHAVQSNSEDDALRGPWVPTGHWRHASRLRDV